jgi:general secretion pathway protein M
MIMLAERGRRLAAIAILLGLIAAIMGLFVYPLLMGFSDRASHLSELVATYQSNRARIASLPELSREAERQSKLLSSLLIAAPDQEQAGEMLREQIENAVEVIKGEVRASEVLAGESGWARATVACRISHSQLAALLTELQRQRPFIVVEAVSVTAEGALNNYQLDELDVRIETSAPFILAQ